MMVAVQPFSSPITVVIRPHEVQVDALGMKDFEAPPAANNNLTVAATYGLMGGFMQQARFSLHRQKAIFVGKPLSFKQ